MKVGFAKVDITPRVGVESMLKKGFLVAAMIFAVHGLHGEAPNADSVPEICAFRHGCRAALSLTFDDGTSDHLQVGAPLIEKYGLKGTFFITVSWIGKPYFLNWAEVKELSARGHEIGNHTMTHKALATLSAKNKSAVEQEINEPLEIIKEKIGVTPLTFAYPFTSYNDEVRLVAEGLHIACRMKHRQIGGKGFTADKANRIIDALIEKGADSSEIIHAIIPFPDAYCAFDSVDIFEEHLKHIKAREGDLWTDTFANVAKYKQNRDFCSVEILGKNEDNQVFVLKPVDGYKPYNDMPLTIKFPDESKIKTVTQAGNTIPVRQKNGVAYFDIIPGTNSPVTVTFN